MGRDSSLYQEKIRLHWVTLCSHSCIWYGDSFGFNEWSEPDTKGRRSCANRKRTGSCSVWDNWAESQKWRLP